MPLLDHLERVEQRLADFTTVPIHLPQYAQDGGEITHFHHLAEMPQHLRSIAARLDLAQRQLNFATQLGQHAAALPHQIGKCLARRQAGVEQQHQQMHEQWHLALDASAACVGEHAQHAERDQDTERQRGKYHYVEKWRVEQLALDGKSGHDRKADQRHRRDRLKRVIGQARTGVAPTRLDQQASGFTLRLHQLLDRLALASHPLQQGIVALEIIGDGDIGRTVQPALHAALGA